MHTFKFGSPGRLRYLLVLAGLLVTIIPLATHVGGEAQAADAEAKPKRKDSTGFARPKEVKLNASVEPLEAKAGELVTVQVQAKIDPGWHLYQYTANPDKEIQRDTYFDFFDLAGLKPEGDWAPATEPIRKPEPAFDNEVLSFYEDEAAWSLKLRIPPGTPPGSKTLRTQINFQICNATSCKPTARITLAMTLNVLPGGATAAVDPAPVDGASKSDPEVATASSATPKEAVASESAKGSPEGAAAAVAPAPENGASKSDPKVANVPTDTVVGELATETAEATVPPQSEVAQRAQQGLIPFLLFSAGGGLLALAMPCVWPMIPITVNFFVKQGNKKKGKTTGLAIAYCLAIIGIFTSFGVLVSFFFSATALQNLAADKWLNAFVAIMFLAFGLSLLGLFEVRLPNFLLNASAKGEGRGGMIGVMFMALTLTITSFTCTFPVVGGLIVMASRGEFFYPIVGLATFSSVLAFPFFLLALAPGLVSSMPKSGDWMNSVKVIGGLVEIGAALKFLNTAEIGFGAVPQDAWFDAPLVLSVWVGIAIVCGLYLLGLFRTDHDHDEVRIGPGRLILGSGFLALALFFAPALFGNPPKSPLWDLVVGILPPDVGDLSGGSHAAVASTQNQGGPRKATSSDPAQAEREESSVHGVLWGMSYEQALEKAKAENRPILIDFTGVYCANCRLMEQTVLSRSEIAAQLANFVTVQLYTDTVPIGSITEAQREELATKNQEFQIELTRETTNPFYVVLTPDGKFVQGKGGYVPPSNFSAFLSDARTKAVAQASERKLAQTFSVE